MKASDHIELVSVSGVDSPKAPAVVMRPGATIKNISGVGRRVTAGVRIHYNDGSWDNFWLAVDHYLNANEEKEFKGFDTSIYDKSYMNMPYANISVEYHLSVFIPVTGDYAWGPGDWFTELFETHEVEVKTYDGWWRAASGMGSFQSTEISIDYVRMFHDGSEHNLPVTNFLQGSKSKLRIRAKNNSSSSRVLMAGWTVTDPDEHTPPNGTGTITKQSSTPPGGTETFESPEISFDKQGNYTFSVGAGVQGDAEFRTFERGTLCSVVPSEVVTELDMSTAVVSGNYDIGEEVNYTYGYAYKGPAQSGTIQVQLGESKVFGWTNPEIILEEEPYSFSKNESAKTYTKQRTFVLPSYARRGADYSIRVYLRTDNGLEARTPTSTSSFKVRETETPTVIDNLAIITGAQEYNHRASFPLEFSFDYMGSSRQGEAQITIGKGSGANFSSVYNYEPETISIDGSSEMQSQMKEVERPIPNSLEAGETYSIRLVLTTSDGKSDSVIKPDIITINPDSKPIDDDDDDYRTIVDHRYPEGKNYVGYVHEGYYEFEVTLEDITGGLSTEEMISEIEKEVKDEGETPLHLKVQEKDAGWQKKHYLFRLDTATEKAGSKSYFTPSGIVTNEEYRTVTPALGLAIKVVIIIGVFLIVSGLVGAWLIKELRKWEAVERWGYPENGNGVFDGIGGITQILPTMVFVMIMVMMMQLMNETMQGMSKDPAKRDRPKPLTRAVEKGLTEAGKLAVRGAREGVKLAEKGVKATSAELDRIRAEKKAAAEEEKEFMRLREEEKLRKLREARQELRRRREERDRVERQYGIA